MKPDWKDAPDWANHLLNAHGHEWFWLENEPGNLKEKLENVIKYNPGLSAESHWVLDSLPIQGRIQMATTPYIHSWDCESRPS